MSNEEIAKKIRQNNDLIQNLLSPNIFTLNNSISNLIRENQELQAQCTHHFVEGYCEFCLKEENRNRG